jgi:DNA polymerase III gamma/tau subunit
MTDVKSNKWNTKHRPTTIDDMIGHEQAVTRIRGMIKTGEYPSAILITGVTSVGKTTIARALATTINGKPISDQIRSGTYKEMDGGTQRTIDDMRELIKLSRFRP